MSEEEKPESLDAESIAKSIESTTNTDVILMALAALASEGPRWADRCRASAKSLGVLRAFEELLRMRLQEFPLFSMLKTADRIFAWRRSATDFATDIVGELGEEKALEISTAIELKVLRVRR